MVGPEDAGGRAELRMVGGCSAEENQQRAGGSVERGRPCLAIQAKAVLSGCRSCDGGRAKSAVLGGPEDERITNGDVGYWRAEENELEVTAGEQQEEEKMPNGDFIPSTCCLLTQEVNANSSQHKCCFPTLEVQRVSWNYKEAEAVASAFQGPGRCCCCCSGAEGGSHLSAKARLEKPSTSSGPSSTLQGSVKDLQDTLLLNKVHAALSAGSEVVSLQENTLQPSDARTNDKDSPSSASTASSPVSARAVSAYFVSADTNRITFMDVSLNSRNTFEVSRRQSAPENLPDGLTLSGDSSGHSESKPKKLGFADFFARNKCGSSGRGSKTDGEDLLATMSRTGMDASRGWVVDCCTGGVCASIGD